MRRRSNLKPGQSGLEQTRDTARTGELCGREQRRCCHFCIQIPDNFVANIVRDFSAMTLQLKTGKSLKAKGHQSGNWVQRNDAVGYLLLDGKAKPRAWKASSAFFRSSAVPVAAREVTDGGSPINMLLKLNVPPAYATPTFADVTPGPAPAAVTFSRVTPPTDVPIESELTEHVEKLGLGPKATISVFRLAISV